MFQKKIPEILLQDSLPYFANQFLEIHDLVHLVQEDQRQYKFPLRRNGQIYVASWERIITTTNPYVQGAPLSFSHRTNSNIQPQIGDLVLLNMESGKRLLSHVKSIEKTSRQDYTHFEGMGSFYLDDFTE